jgi:hypothetical protein
MKFAISHFYFKKIKKRFTPFFKLFTPSVWHQVNLILNRNSAILLNGRLQTTLYGQVILYFTIKQANDEMSKNNCCCK